MGHDNEILIGWYMDDKRNGNWMWYSVNCLTITEKGWYENDKKIEEMKNDD